MAARISPASAPTLTSSAGNTRGLIEAQHNQRRAAAAPAAQSTAVTRANRVRLAAHRWAAKLPRTQPYAASPSHCPSAITDERFNRLAAATADEFVKEVIAAVQEKESYYHDSERASSERRHLLSTVDRKHKAEATAIKAFEAEQLGVVQEVCREVQQLTPAALRFEFQQVERGRMNTPSPSRSRGRATNQRNRGDSGPNR